LTAVAELKNGQTSNFTQGYSFDQWGNRTIDQQGTTANAGINNLSCWIDPNTNRLYAFGDQGINDPTQRLIRYDAAGNQTSDYYGPTWTGSRAYDAENRMISATNSATNTTSNYTYDGDGRRVRRTDPALGEIWQVYGMEGELLAEYGVNGPAILPQKEYGYRNGQLLITAVNGDGLRLWNFMKNVAVRFGVYGWAIGDSQLLSAANSLSTAGAQGQSQMLSAARTQVQNVIMWSNIPSDTDYVTALYLSYLQRFPDSNELNAWVSQVPTIGRDAVRDGFAYSDEFAARVSNLRGTASSDTERTDAFVQYMYNAILHRSANTTEDTTAVSSIDTASATSQATVVTAAKDLGRGLFNSAEYTSRPGLTPHDFVYDLYQAFYSSSPDASWDYWTDQVGANWENKQTVLEYFINGGPLQAGTLYRELLWLVPDQLGTPRMIAERTGSLAGIKRHDYLPFGEELFAGTGGRTPAQGYTSDSVRQHFTGYEADGETGLNFAQARYQSPVQGRFTSVDPLMASASVFDPQSLNRYSYVQNNPLNFTDPTGMMLSDIGVYQTNDPEEAATLQRKSDSDFQRAINGGYAASHGGSVNYDDKGRAYFMDNVLQMTLDSQQRVWNPGEVPFYGYLDNNQLFWWTTLAYSLPGVSAATSVEPPDENVAKDAPSQLERVGRANSVLGTAATLRDLELAGKVSKGTKVLGVITAAGDVVISAAQYRRGEISGTHLGFNYVADGVGLIPHPIAKGASALYGIVDATTGWFFVDPNYWNANPPLYNRQLPMSCGNCHYERRQ
jgi:RHS repeat-associated protein